MNSFDELSLFEKLVTTKWESVDIIEEIRRRLDRLIKIHFMEATKIPFNMRQLSRALKASSDYRDKHLYPLLTRLKSNESVYDLALKIGLNPEKYQEEFRRHKSESPISKDKEPELSNWKDQSLDKALYLNKIRDDKRTNHRTITLQKALILKNLIFAVKRLRGSYITDEEYDEIAHFQLLVILRDLLENKEKLDETLQFSTGLMFYLSIAGKLKDRIRASNIIDEMVSYDLLKDMKIDDEIESIIQKLETKKRKIDNKPALG